MTQQDRPPLASPDSADPHLMTLSQTARLLGQPVEGIFRAAMCGRLPVVWLGPRPYVNRAAMPVPTRGVCAVGQHNRCANANRSCPCACHAADLW